MGEKVVLFIDDEMNILKSLRRLFRREDYKTEFFSSGEEALIFLNENHCDLIISDIRMPVMDGFELLSEVKRLYPSITRVALSGYTDQRLIFKLIDQNIAKVFLFKPWDSLEIRQGVKGLLEFNEVLKDKDLLLLINNIDVLPSLPSLYLKINAMIREERDISEIASVVQKDQSTTLKILRLANSAFFGRKTGDVYEAVMSIGLNNLKNIILGSAIYSGPQKVKSLLEDTWNDAIVTNRILHVLYSKFLDKKLPSVYGSVGLLIDVGKVIFYLHKFDIYQEILKLSAENKKPIHYFEKELFKVSHQELSGYLLNWWELPHEYVEAALFHHNPSHESLVNRELVSAVHIASYYGSRHREGSENYDYLDPRSFSYLGLDKDTVEAKIKEILEA